jgi:hypothetical protein
MKNVRFEIFTAVTMKNVVFWDIKTQFIPHKRHITSPLQRSAGYFYVRYEVFTAGTTKNAVSWDIKTQFLPNGRHYISATELSRLIVCKFEFFTAVTMKNVILWNIKPSPHRTGDAQPSQLMLSMF